MWKDSIRNIVVIFQPNILRIVGFYVRHSANLELLRCLIIAWDHDVYKKNIAIIMATYYNIEAFQKCQSTVVYLIKTNFNR